VKKENLPKKICIVCGREFTWRKKWNKVWAEVKYCSDKCRINKKKLLDKNKLRKKILVLQQEIFIYSSLYFE
jgi:hypothetical protein